MARVLRCIAAAAMSAVGLTLASTVPLVGTTTATAAPSALTWSQMPAPTPPQGGNGLFGLSCTSATFCMSVGPIENDGAGARAYEWNGASWSPTTMPDGMNKGLWSVSCVDQNFCVAVVLDPVQAGRAVPSPTHGMVWRGRR
jgi:hypothetical protein